MCLTPHSRFVALSFVSCLAVGCCHVTFALTQIWQSGGSGWQSTATWCGRPRRASRAALSGRSCLVLLVCGSCLVFVVVSASLCRRPPVGALADLSSVCPSAICCSLIYFYFVKELTRHSLGGVLAHETDPFFEYQYNESGPCRGYSSTTCGSRRKCRSVRSR